MVFRFFITAKPFCIALRSTGIENFCVFPSFGVERVFIHPRLPSLSNFTINKSFLYSSTHVSDSVSDEEKRKLKIWLEQCKYNGINLPEHIKEEDMEHLASLNEYKRLKYINFLFIRHLKKQKEGIKKIKKREQRKTEKEEREKLQPDHIKYGLWKNSMFLKVNKSSMKDFFHTRLLSAITHTQPVIVDLAFDDYMDNQESKSLAKQLSLSLTLNEQNCNPFNLTFCNVNFNSLTMNQLKKLYPPALNSEVPINFTHEHYLDLYPKEKLVYLSPNATFEMKTFDPEAIYIIGGIVDRNSKPPLTRSKAKKEGIKLVKFPLDRYHIFKHHKSLSIHVVIAILLDIQNTGDWRKALENIPPRFIQTSTERHRARWHDKRIVPISSSSLDGVE